MLLYMSAAGAILIAGILLMRPAESRFLPPRFFVLLWDIALARLLLPVAFPAPFGLDILAAQPPSDLAESDAGILSPWTILWLAGALACAAHITWQRLRERNVLRDALPLTPDALDRITSLGIETRRARILTSDRITTPVAGGVFRPRIILPATWMQWDDETVRFALTHELSHLAVFDTVQKLFAAAAQCVHWFNPIVWIMRRVMDRDLERACDERVLYILGDSERCAYAETLVRLASQRADTCPVYTSGFSHSAVHERVVSMLCAGKPTAAAMLTGLLIVTCCSAAFAAAAPQLDVESMPSAARSAREDVYIFDTDTGHLFHGDEFIGALGDPRSNTKLTTVTAVTIGDTQDVLFMAFPGIDPDVTYMLSQVGTAG